MKESITRLLRARTSKKPLPRELQVRLKERRTRVVVKRNRTRKSSDGKEKTRSSRREIGIALTEDSRKGTKRKKEENV